MEKLWKELKLDQIINTLLQQHEYEFDVKSAIKVMVFNRAINAQSKLSTYDWLQNDDISRQLMILNYTICTGDLTFS